MRAKAFCVMLAIAVGGAGMHPALADPGSKEATGRFGPFNSFQEPDQQKEIDDLRRRLGELERKVEGKEDKDDKVEDDYNWEEQGDPGDDDATGTDPRAFGTKFMPYYRYTELRTDVRINEFVLFGLVKFDDNVAVTYEIPVATNIHYKDLREFQQGLPIPDNPGQGFPGGGVPNSDLDPDGDNTGLGDSIFRMMFKINWLKTTSPVNDEGELSILPLFETTVPTATNDVIGGETWIGSPGFAIVMDMPFPGSFIAGMNFYDFDIVRDNSRDQISRYRGRWFFMQPLTPPKFAVEENPELPDLGILGGLYLLPEAQPVYDFETDDFSFWIAPELGKVISEGRIVYAKPGWGVDPDRFDREFSFEAGLRWFF